MPVVGKVEVPEGVNDRARPLGRGCTVEVDQSVAIDPFSQHWELRAQGFQIRSRLRSYRNRIQAPHRSCVTAENGPRPRECRGTRHLSQEIPSIHLYRFSNLSRDFLPTHRLATMNKTR